MYIVADTNTAFQPRSTEVQADQGFIQYQAMLQHRQSWQEHLSLKTSLAEVQSFCLELSKKLDMRFQSPPLPVNLSVEDSASTARSIAPLSSQSEDIQTVAALFD